eukprot:531217_1
MTIDFIPAEILCICLFYHCPLETFRKFPQDMECNQLRNTIQMQRSPGVEAKTVYGNVIIDGNRKNAIYGWLFSVVSREKRKHKAGIYGGLTFGIDSTERYLMSNFTERYEVDDTTFYSLEIIEGTGYEIK